MIVALWKTAKYTYIWYASTLGNAMVHCQVLSEMAESNVMMLY